MILLNSALLAFLGVLGLPLLLHLLHLRRRRPQNLPTLRFLKEIEQNRLKRLNLTRLLLLLVRMALLAALVFAFARPISRTFLAADEDPELLILLLDDTASMREGDGKGQSRWDQARSLAAEISSRHASSEQAILLLSRPEDLRGPMSSDAVSRQLAGLSASWSGLRIDEAWPVLEKLLDNYKGSRCALHLVSDLEAEPFALGLAAEQYPGLESVLHQAGSDRDAIALTGSMAEGSQDLRLHLTFEGQSTRRQGLQLNVLANGERVIQRMLDERDLSGSALDLDLQLSQSSTWIKGESFLEGLPEWRGRRFWTARLNEPYRALLAAKDRDLAAVLLAASRAALGEEAVLLLDRTEAVQSGDVILAGLGRAWSTEDRSRLLLARREGRGLFLFVEPGADAQMASAQLEALALGRAHSLRLAGQGLLQMKDLDLEHPVLAGILQKQARLRMPGAGTLLEISSAQSRTLARSGTLPLIAAIEDESGRALILCLNPLDGDPALSAQGFFAPFVHGGIAWLASRESSGSSVDCGRASRLKLPVTQEESRDWELVMSDKRWKLEQERGLNLPALSEPGVYELQLNGAQVALVSANVPLAECTQIQHSLDDWAKADARWAQTNESERMNAGLKDLSPWLLLLALLLLLLESWLSTGRRTHESEF